MALSDRRQARSNPTIDRTDQGKASRSMFTIRPAVPDDAPVMHAIQMRAFAEEGRLCGNTQIPPLTETPADIEIHIRTQTALVVLYEGSIVGAARGIVESGVCTLRGICVEPASHGQGIGSALLETALQWSRDHHLRSLIVEINTKNHPAIAFYTHHGFAFSGFHERFYSDQEIILHLARMVR